MKFLFLLVSLLIFMPFMAFSQGSWERVVTPTEQNLQSVCFTDSLYGWTVGDSGTILHTKDGGKNWTLQNASTDKDIVVVHFINRDMGWAAAVNFTEPPFGTILLKTTNGGTSWIPSTYPEENIFITCIYYFDSLTGWMGGKPHALVKTTDGGNTWNQASIDTSTLAFFPVLKLTFLNEEVGFASGGIFDIAGVIWRTHNGGDLWYAIDPSQAPADEVHGLHIFNELDVMGSGGDPDYGYGVGMIRSSDGGVNWDYDEIGVQGIAFDLDFRTPSQVWSPLGPLKKLIFSADSGNTWTEVPTPDSVAVFDMTFPDSLHGCGVGYNGGIIRYMPPVHPGVKEPGFEKERWNLRIFPNPTAGNTKYEIRTVVSGEMVFEVIGLNGSKIAEFYHGFLTPGIHSFSFEAGQLPEGIYLIQLSIDGVVAATKKLVVVH